MIILDTNVVSEAMKTQPQPVVVDWIDAQFADDMFLTSINLAELHSGIRIMPVGQRRDALAQILKTSLERLFGPRVLPFDEAAAFAYASIFARCRILGSPIGVADAQIAAIALVHGCAVATRDERPFHAAGVAVINPWKT
jgi:predicted nucleic acid-binding protein